MAWLIPAIGAVSGLFGAFGANNQANKNSQQQQQLIEQLMGNTQAVQNETLRGIQGIQGNAGSYLSVLPALLASLTGEQKPGGAIAQAPGAASSFISDAASPTQLAATSGVNTPGIAQQATGYLSNPGSTNLAALSPGALAFFSKMMQTGINPQAAQNAQNQLTQQFDTSMNTIRANATPGMNLSAAEQAGQNNLLTQSTNLGSQLAGESQGLQAQGAQGILSTGGQLDQQTMQMLVQALTSGSQYNQTVLGNQQSGAGFGQQLLDTLANFANTGNQLDEFGVSSLGALGSNLSQQGQYFSGLGANRPQPQNPFSFVGNALAGLNFGSGGAGGGGSSSGGGFMPYAGIGGVSQFGSAGNLIDVLG